MWPKMSPQLWCRDARKPKHVSPPAAASRASQGEGGERGALLLAVVLRLALLGHPERGLLHRRLHQVVLHRPRDPAPELEAARVVHPGHVLLGGVVVHVPVAHGVIEVRLARVVEAEGHAALVGLEGVLHEVLLFYAHGGDDVPRPVLLLVGHVLGLVGLAADHTAHHLGVAFVIGDPIPDDALGHGDVEDGDAGAVAALVCDRSEDVLSVVEGL
mmetsp:Transcript_19573/g.65745  ORF Transcript_19573/g.65745 Transcript_19573/m.65745 type:complete len:215 (-) Transcript_19573:175-819(-)